MSEVNEARPVPRMQKRYQEELRAKLREQFSTRTRCRFRVLRRSS